MVDVLGVTKVRGCCTFLWMQDAHAPRRIVFARPYHCAACVGEMARTAKLQRVAIAGSVAMDRVRSMLAGRRAELIDRWRRQLTAAAEAGFALDPATAAVLPEMLEALDRALERRFRAVAPGTPALEAEPRRAAMQSSLLGDFLFDAVLEACPDANGAEQRLLSDALAHAAVEVLVRGALRREEGRRRRDSVRLAALAHDLRNSVTTARLALDLLRKKGALADGKVARALEQSVQRLRSGIEATLFDEVLTVGGLKLAPIRLLPVLSHAAGDFDGSAKRLSMIFEKPDSALRAQGDARVVAPAIRGLLEAAVELALPGATVQFGAQAVSKAARITLSVNRARKLTGKRLPAVPGLEFARRAARAHGGSVRIRTPADAGWELHFNLPQPH